jgi:hypothetical protein
MMKNHGQYKIRNRKEADRLPPFAGTEVDGAALAEKRESLSGPVDVVDALLDEFEHHEGRTQRLLGSLRDEILTGGGGLHLRIRRVFHTPREIFRLELELPDHSYQRTTFLDRDALESLLEADDVRAIVETGRLGSDSHP